jgi:nucleotide-binding universal stress UspA family protein
MNKKILFAVDGSPKCLEALSAIGRLLQDQVDCHLTLFHCIQQLSTLYTVKADEVDASKVFSKEAERVGDLVLQESNRVLLKNGFPSDRIELKVELGSEDPAEDVLKQAEADDIGTIALGRRGLSRVNSFLLGSVSDKVARYSNHGAVWIVDTPVHRSRKVLLAVEGVQDCQVLTNYAGEFLGSIPDLKYTLLHLIPPVPPAFWDDGHILSSEERRVRRDHVEKWRLRWTQQVEKYMAEARDFLVQKGIPSENVTTSIVPTKEGIARDLLNEISESHYEIVLVGKRSFQKNTSFLLGNRANKILHNVKGVILCILDS